MAEQITYKEAGVDIHAAAELVGDIGELRQRTEKNRKLFGAFGLFAAGFDLSGYKAVSYTHLTLPTKRIV